MKANPILPSSTLPVTALLFWPDHVNSNGVVMEPRQTGHSQVTVVGPVLAGN